MNTTGKELAVGSSPIPFTYKDLQLFTDDFREENLICAAHFGKVYRGKIPEGWDAGEGWHVTVEIWEDIVKTDPLHFVAVPSDCATRFRTKQLGRLPVVHFAARRLATLEDAMLMMEFRCDGVFVGLGLFKSGDSVRRVRAIVQAVHYSDLKEVESI
ncbi:hypothetical protein RJ639_045850 [Escallonia herrerae]|uniref:pyridoxal 5'-phosphate synthase (glutamine hydrolyzing) n=1 Tax=Escallonia herrerae TaxID=1293975 RepID=A0AA88W6M9_9ASTE|nr:hypothetical protein RJ639_045850 [Escallonia herrerae]